MSGVAVTFLVAFNVVGGALALRFRHEGVQAKKPSVVAGNEGVAICAAMNLLMVAVVAVTS